MTVGVVHCQDFQAMAWAFMLSLLFALAAPGVERRAYSGRLVSHAPSEDVRRSHRPLDKGTLRIVERCIDTCALEIYENAVLEPM
jgi:hypothetical protein